MKKLILIFLFVAVLYSVVASATLTCNFVDTSSGSCTDASVMRIEDTTGGHAQLPGGTTFDWMLCCSDPDLPDLSGACSGENVITTVLRVSEASAEGHVQRDDMDFGAGNYNFDVCLSSSTTSAGIECTYTTDLSCPTHPTFGDYQCIATISDDTNAHIGDCASYETKVCCVSGTDNAPPELTSIDATPEYVKSDTLVTITSIADDPNGDLIYMECGEISGGNEICSTAGSPVVQNPTCSFTPSVAKPGWSTSDGWKDIYCLVYEDTVENLVSENDAYDQVFSDNTPPTGTISHSPVALIANGETVTFNVDSASDAGSGLKDIRIYVDGGSKKVCGATLPCSYQASYDGLSTHSYFVKVWDMVGNFYESTPHGSFQVCGLSSITAAPNADCAVGVCEIGDHIDVSASYAGACPPDPVYIQVDASGGACDIQHDGGDISGIGSPCSAPCSFQWQIPDIPPDCEGEAMTFTFGAIWDGVGPPPPSGGKWYDSNVMAGGFNFFGDAEPTIDNLYHSPGDPILPDTDVTVTADVSDDIGLDLVEIYVDGALEWSCAPGGVGVTTFSCATPARTYSIGNHPYYVVVRDSGGQPVTSPTQSFDVVSGVGPSLYVFHKPNEVSQYTTVELNATAHDDDGVAFIQISAFDGQSTGTQDCTINPPETDPGCVGPVVPYPPGTLIEYYAASRSANYPATPDIYDPPEAPSVQKNYTVCDLTSVRLVPFCGDEQECVEGERVGILSQYTGDCPQTSYIQVDAVASTIHEKFGLCTINNEGGSMQGVQGTCDTTGDETFCWAYWTIPQVHPACAEMEITPLDGYMSLGDYHPGGEEFDSVTATGGFTFAESSPPDVTVTLTPSYPPIIPWDTNLQIEVRGTDISGIKKLNLTVDGLLIKNCTSAPTSPMTCVDIRKYPTGMHTYKAIAVDGVGQKGYAQGLFEIDISPDTVAPYFTDLSHAPSVIGYNTPVTVTAIATDDDSDVWSVEIYKNNTLMDTCLGATCSSNFGLHPAGTIVTYYANATDIGGNVGRSATQSYTVCQLDNTHITPNCPGGYCNEGEEILVTADYHGACPDPGFIEVTANSGCKITSIGPDMIGIQTQCSGPCTSGWTIPAVPLKCQARTVEAVMGYIRNTGFDGPVFDNVTATGSFRFDLDLTDLDFIVELNLSDTTPNLGDTIIGNLTCYIRKYGETVECDRQTGLVTNITINGRDYLGETGWDFLKNWDGTKWTIPIDTREYNAGPDVNSFINVTMSYAGFVENSTGKKNYLVNFPPTIENVGHNADPDPAVIGGKVQFYANIADPEGDAIDNTSSCKDQSCSAAYISMSDAGARYESPGTAQPNAYVIQSGDSLYYIYANDSKGAANYSGPHFLVTSDYRLWIDTVFPDAGVFVPYTSAGIPNFTKGMPMNFLTTAEIEYIPTSAFSVCNEDNCTAKYSFNEAVPSNIRNVIQWDEFENAWRGEASTASLACEQQHDLSVLVENTNKTFRVKNETFYLNCEPNIMVIPIERRVALGQSSMRIFEVIVVNPHEDSRDFIIEMKSTDPNGKPLVWVEFDCTGVGNCDFPDGSNNDKIKLSGVPAGGYSKAYVKLGSPGVAGVFPIDFEANVAGDPNFYKTTGTLMIYSEGLPEFALYQLIIAMFMSIIIYIILARKKGF